MAREHGGQRRGCGELRHPCGEAGLLTAWKGCRGGAGLVLGEACFGACGAACRKRGDVAAEGGRRSAAHGAVRLGATKRRHDGAAPRRAARDP